MYSLLTTQVRPSVDVPFFWETDLEDHVAYQANLESKYGPHMTLGERTYSQDRLTYTILYTADSYEKFMTGHQAAAADLNLQKYFLARDNYNFDKNIIRTLTEV